MCFKRVAVGGSLARIENGEDISTVCADGIASCKAETIARFLTVARAADLRQRTLVSLPEADIAPSVQPVDHRSHRARIAQYCLPFPVVFKLEHVDAPFRQRLLHAPEDKRILPCLSRKDNT